MRNICIKTFILFKLKFKGPENVFSQWIMRSYKNTIFPTKVSAVWVISLERFLDLCFSLGSSHWFEADGSIKSDQRHTAQTWWSGLADVLTSINNTCNLFPLILRFKILVFTGYVRCTANGGLKLKTLLKVTDVLLSKKPKQLCSSNRGRGSWVFI